MLTFDDLDDDQRACIDFGCEGEDSLICADIGTGKTVIAYTIARDALNAQTVDRWLVVAPLLVCTDAWANEHREWEHLRTPGRGMYSDLLKVGIATGTEKNRRAVCEDTDLQFIVINYENLTWFLNEYGVPDNCGLICDEIDKLKACGTDRFRKFRHAVPKFKRRIGLTGTIQPNDLTELWGQVFIVDGGASFGKSFYKWRDKYFYPTDFKRYNWRPLPSSREKLLEAIQDITFRLEAKGLPDIEMLIPRAVVMPDDLRDKYKKLSRHFVLELEEGDVDAANSAVLQGKLQQLCAGFSYVAPGMTWRKEQKRFVVWHSKAKFDALEELLKELGDEQVLVFYHFQEEYDELRRRFGIVNLKGGGTGPNTRLSMWNEGRMQYLALHPASAGHGLNLQKSGAHHIVFLTMPWSGGLFKQSVGRLCRRRQTAPVIYIHTLVFDNTVDQEVADRVHDRMESLQDLHDDLLQLTYDNREENPND